MDETLIIDPARLRQFGPASGTTFCLVTNPNYANCFKIETEAPYDRTTIVLTDDRENFEELIVARIPEPAHVLVISPDRFFESPPQDLIGPRRKLMAMACNSTPTDLSVIKHFLGIMERTDPEQQEAFAERFFGLVEDSDYLRIVNEACGTELTFDHFARDYVWNQQAGCLEWGGQQIVPSGEISVLPIEIRSFDATLCLALDGEITLSGHPILHSGTTSFLREDQARLHKALACMTEEPIVATLKSGIVTSVRPVTSGSNHALRALEALLAVDSRYGTVWEIGFALNVVLDLLPGNHAMNEVYGGSNGCIHWGLGLTPYTQYHLDVISPGTTVLTAQGVPVLGGAG